MITIQSGKDRVLQAVIQETTAPIQGAVLILHGIGDRLSYWAEAQQLLAEEGFTSLVVHFAGYGRSSGPLTPNNVRADIHAAYAHLRTLLPANTPLFAMGFSLGTGALADAASLLSPPPCGIILCQAFPSCAPPPPGSPHRCWPASCRISGRLQRRCASFRLHSCSSIPTPIRFFRSRWRSRSKPRPRCSWFIPSPLRSRAASATTMSTCTLAADTGYQFSSFCASMLPRHRAKQAKIAAWNPPKFRSSPIS